MQRRKFIKGSVGLGALAAAGASGMVSAPSLAQTGTARAVRSGKKRVMVGAFAHETNTFNPFVTDVDVFKSHTRYGADVLKDGGCIGGFMEIMNQHGQEVECIGAVSSGASPAGTVTAKAFDFVSGAMLEFLDKNQVDAVYLNIHGAMACENHPDGEGALVEMVRKKVGPNIPIMLTADLHATLTNAKVNNSNSVSVYRTYPHVDTRQCGIETAWVMLKTLRGEIKPVVAFAKRPLMICPPLNVLPNEMPMKLTYDRAREMERTLFGALLACPAQGFMQQDVPECGVGAAVTIDRNREMAQKMADELGDIMFAHRKEYWVHLPDAAEAVSLAMQSKKPPVAISDGGDNIGGGTPGDGTLLLFEILKQRVDTAFVPIWDAESARKAAAAGKGATVSLDVGGKSHPFYGPPVSLTGQVVAVYISADKKDISARVDVKGVSVLLNSRPIGPGDMGRPNALGIYPEKYRITVCKGGFAFRTTYRPDTYSYILADTPGFTSTGIKNWTYTKVKRPIYPLDDI